MCINLCLVLCKLDWLCWYTVSYFYTAHSVIISTVIYQPQHLQSLCKRESHASECLSFHLFLGLLVISDGQIQIMLWFKSWLLMIESHVLIWIEFKRFDLETCDLIWIWFQFMWFDLWCDQITNFSDLGQQITFMWRHLMHYMIDYLSWTFWSECLF